MVSKRWMRSLLRARIFSSVGRGTAGHLFAKELSWVHCNHFPMDSRDGQWICEFCEPGCMVVCASEARSVRRIMDKRDFLKTTGVFLTGTLLKRFASAEGQAHRTNWAGNYE